MFVQSVRCIALSFRSKPEFSIGDNLIEFVKQWLQFGHIVTESLNVAADNQQALTLCGQINNLLCYFGKLGHVTKPSLMYSFCCSFMVACSDILVIQLSKICCNMKKRLEACVGPPYTMHCEILPVLFNTLLILDEMYRRSATFTNNCLSSTCTIVHNVTCHGVFLFSNHFRFIVFNLFLSVYICERNKENNNNSCSYK